MMNELLLLISCLILIFFIKDIIVVVLVLCILSYLWTYLSSDKNYLYIYNYIVPTEQK